MFYSLCPSVLTVIALMKNGPSSQIQTSQSQTARVNEKPVRTWELSFFPSFPEGEKACQTGQPSFISGLQSNLKAHHRTV